MQDFIKPHLLYGPSYSKSFKN